MDALGPAVETEAEDWKHKLRTKMYPYVTPLIMSRKKTVTRCGVAQAEHLQLGKKIG